MTEDLDKTQLLGVNSADNRTTVIVPPAERTTLSASGGRLENHYPVLEMRGGKGVTGMGVVYIVEDATRIFAVKSFQRRYARDLAFIERFVREARTWMLIGFHPNVVHAYRVEIIDAIPYLFMEYVPGDTVGRHSLAEYLRQGPFSLPQAMSFALQFCEGMAHAGRAVPGLVHRDIKPDNVLITPEGILKVSDFGLVRARGDDDTTLEALARSAIETRGRTQLTELGSVFGTPAYMAPEQFEGAENAREAADIYAFGCCLYEMLTGRAPFSAEDLPTLDKIVALRTLHLEGRPRPVCEVRAECPGPLGTLTMRCLEKAPEDRWPSFDALRTALRELYPEVCGHAQPPTAHADATPEQIAAQMRSLTLLDGYLQAIRLKRLRERHEESPYAFHLALASYFHCQGDLAEEERQLDRALESRTRELGSEAVRRIAELYVRAGRAEAALAIVEPFALQGPVAADEVLEPRLHALMAVGRIDEARHLANQLPDSRRKLWLAMAVTQAAGDAAALRLSAEAMLEDVLDEILCPKGMETLPGSPGFGYRADPDVLRAVLTGLRPEASLPMFEAPVFWPDIGGAPDYSGPMAWLSEACGALGHCAALLESERALFAARAEALGWPRRMRDHLEREEYWFWLQQATPVTERCHAGK